MSDREKPAGETPPHAEHGHEEPMPEGDHELPRGVHTMSIVRWLLVAMMAVIAGASGLYYFGVFDKIAISKAPATAQYYCPMHPSVVQDHPGECPICSMTLVPREVGAGNTATTSSERQTTTGMVNRTDAMAPVGSEATVPGVVAVDLTPERIQLMGMRSARVVRENLAPELRTVAFITPNENGLSQVHTRFAGWLEQLLVSESGQYVKRGQVLATVYSPDLLTAQQEFLNATRWSTEKGKSDSEAHHVVGNLADEARRRLQLLGISSEEIDEIERSGKAVRALAIRSPVSGYVTKKTALAGAFVDPSAELFQVADLSSIWALADIYEYEIPRVKVGQHADLKLASSPGKTWSGRLDFIYPTVDPATRTLRVRLSFANPALALKPGMYADVTLHLGGQEGLTIPEEALVDTGEVQYVFLARSGGHFEPRRVQTGARSNGKIAILDGLSEGDIVVTTANFFIDSESHLRAAVEGLAPGGSGPEPEGPPGTPPTAPPTRTSPDCDKRIDKPKWADKYRECLQCEVVHRGMGTMEDDCKNAIAKPWR